MLVIVCMLRNVGLVQGVCVCVYRLPATPLHGAVVLFDHPRMVQQLPHSNTPLGVHLQDARGNYKSMPEGQHHPTSGGMFKNTAHVVQIIFKPLCKFKIAYFFLPI